MVEGNEGDGQIAPRPVSNRKRQKPRREVPDVIATEPIIKVNVDLTATMLGELEEVALLLNISRQAVIKSFIKDGLDRHFAGQSARRNF
jgi:hypothetical protein